MFISIIWAIIRQQSMGKFDQPRCCAKRHATRRSAYSTKSDAWPGTCGWLRVSLISTKKNSLHTLENYFCK
jgi:hypothetical protein